MAATNHHKRSRSSRLVLFILVCAAVAAAPVVRAAHTQCYATPAVCGPEGALTPAAPPASTPPELTPEQQAQVFDRLRAALRLPPPYTGAGAGNDGSAAAAPAAPAAEAPADRTGALLKSILGVLSARYGVVRPANQPGVLSDGGQPQGELIQLLTYLEAPGLKVGVDVPRGGVVAHISSARMPPQFANVSLINSWDCGRMLQQSYYGCEDRTCWVDHPWRWNPVACGSWNNLPAALLDASVRPGRVRVAAHPRNWGGEQLLEDVVLASAYRLGTGGGAAAGGAGDAAAAAAATTAAVPTAGSSGGSSAPLPVLEIENSIEFTGAAAHPVRTQEVPAFFADRRLGVLALYTGAAPWTGGELTLAMPGGVNEDFTPTERWAAYIEPETGYGIGVFSPAADGLTAYRVGRDGSARPSDVSYLAMTARFAVPANATRTYKAYVAAGRVDEIREAFRRCAVAEGLAPAAAAPAAPTPAAATPAAAAAAAAAADSHNHQTAATAVAGAAAASLTTAAAAAAAAAPLAAEAAVPRRLLLSMQGAAAATAARVSRRLMAAIR